MKLNVSYHMKATNKLFILVILSFFTLQTTTASINFSNKMIMQEKRPRTHDTMHLWLGINELIGDINKDKKEDKEKIKPLARNEYTLAHATEKVTELGVLLKYGISGSDNLLECCKALDSIIERYIKDEKERDRFYLRVNNKVSAWY